MPSVLVVDDSDLVRSELKEMFEPKGYEVLEASDGDLGLKQAMNAKQIDVIISDYNMPNMNGIDMINQIRKLENHRSTPCLVLSTETSLELRKKGKEAGVFLWMVKPVNENVLVGVVEQLNTSKEAS